MSIACSMGIMAYNEEANIGPMLECRGFSTDGKGNPDGDCRRRQWLY